MADPMTWVSLAIAAIALAAIARFEARRARRLRADMAEVHARIERGRGRGEEDDRG